MLTAWLPVIVWLAYVLTSPTIQGWVPNPDAPLLSVAAMATLMSVSMAWVVAHPNRGLHDRAVGTWVVGR